jgi:hypothetical protein
MEDAGYSTNIIDGLKQRAALLLYKSNFFLVKLSVSRIITVQSTCSCALKNMMLSKTLVGTHLSSSVKDAFGKFGPSSSMKPQVDTFFFVSLK